MSELKRCPFCGGEARLADEPIGKGKYLYSVLCENDCVVQGTYFTTAETAIEAWNNRKPLERVIERLEEVDNRQYVALCTSDVFVDGQASGLERAIEIIKEELM